MKEREARKLEEMAAERILLEERERAEAVALEAGERAEAAARNSPEESMVTAGATKRSRSSGSSMPTAENVNTYIQDVNKGGESDEEMAEMNMEEIDLTEVEQARGPDRSPEKKKKRKERRDKQERKKDKHKSKDTGGTSILKTGRFSPAAEATGARRLNLGESKMSVTEKRSGEWGSHVHKSKRAVLVCSKVCSQEGTEAKMNEFVQAARTLYAHMVKVDPTLVWEPVLDGGSRLWDPQGLPADFTDCGQWIKVSGDAGVFEMKKPRKSDMDRGQLQGVDEDELMNPEVWFQFCLSCDVDVDIISERVSFEWARLGGRRMMVKEIPSFATKAAVTLYRVRNDPNHSVMIPEISRMLEVARDKATAERLEYFSIAEVPQFQLSAQTPKIHGQNTQLFQGWDWRRQMWRKTLHIIVEASKVDYMQELFTFAKEFKLVEKYFGPHARVVMVYDSTKKGKSGELRADLSKYDMSAVASYSRRHINYQANSRYDGIRGILDLDKAFDIPAVTDSNRVVGAVSLRDLLYHRVKTKEGHPLFLEVHQGQPMGPVDVVVGVYEEAERMLLMINKNPGAFLFFYLTSVVGMDEQFVHRVVSGTVDPTFVREIKNCKWDKEDLVLTTSEDAHNEKLEEMEKAAWYTDAYGDNVFDMSKKEKGKKFSASELEDLHAVNSVKTASKKPGRYEGSPGVESFVVGQKQGTSTLNGAEKESGDDLEGKTREELLAMLRKASISSMNTGSQPTARKAGVGSDDLDADSTLSGSGSSGSSSSSGSTSSSSAEVQLVASPPAQGE
jgi:hypothetical protein